MKLPAVSIVFAFAAGIALSARLAVVSPLPAAAIVILILGSGIVLLHRNYLRIAALCALVAWFLLGLLALRLERGAVPANHVTRLVAVGELDTSVALRWRGQLRQDPQHLPWGTRYDIDLDEVESAGLARPVSGGLRLSYFAVARDAVSHRGLRAGDRVEALVRARPPRNFGNPGAPDIAANLAQQFVHLTGSLRSDALLRKMDGPRPSFSHRIARIRGALLAQLDSLFVNAPWPDAVLHAMLLGDRTFVDRERADAFQKSATYHVLVIAGLHVAAFAAFVFWLAKRLRLNLFARIAITLIVLAGYVAIVEDRPPILRAALMAAAYLTARLLYRRVELLNSIAIAALMILIGRPSALATASFQLSFLAVGSIGGLALPWIARTSEPYRRALAHLSDVTRDAAHAPRVAQFRLDLRAASAFLARHLPARLTKYSAPALALPFRAGIALWELVLVSTTIQIGMLPLLAHYFNRVSPVGPLANIPAVLLTGIIVPLGFLTLGMSLIWRSFGAVLAHVLGWLVSALSTSVQWTAHLHWASYRIPGPPVWLLAASLIALLSLAAAARSARRRWEWLLAAPLATLVFLVAAHPFAPSLNLGKLEVTVIDVGQGDSLFVAYPDGGTMLIDGGGTPGTFREGGIRLGIDTGEEAVSPFLWHRGVKKLNVVALTHAHQDHIGGLAAVLQNFRVEELWIGRDVESPAFRALLAEAAARGVRIVYHYEGEAFSQAGVQDQILWPPITASSEPPKNDDSLVLRLVYGDTQMLLPGDIERRVEDQLDHGTQPLDAAFLKVAHHGSKTSTTPRWLAQVRPSFAAISVGDNNPFGHPNPEVLDRLEASGVRVLRTDRDGAITALSDGRTITVSRFLSSGPH